MSRPLLPLFAPVQRVPGFIRPRRQSLLLAAVLALAAPGLPAQTVQLTWQPVPGAAFYRVHAGTNAGQYFTNWPVATNSAAWPLPDLGRWWFAVTSCTSNDQQSGYSAAVTVEALPAPILSGLPHVRLTTVLETSANLTNWQTMTSAPTWLPATNAAGYYRNPSLRIESGTVP